jgi:hypothetical protein
MSGRGSEEPTAGEAAARHEEAQRAAVDRAAADRAGEDATGPDFWREVGLLQSGTTTTLEMVETSGISIPTADGSIDLD